MEFWQSFGKDYNNRNFYSPTELDDMYNERYGISRSEMNNVFLGDIDRDAKILEVGCNVGQQLRHLQLMGFENLYGIEIQQDAVEMAKSRTKNINIIQGSAFDLPFKDANFDLVFTSGVLIHIAPKNIKKVLEETYRCSKGYIWGFEYYADKYTQIAYRGRDNLLWKANFAGLYLNLFDDLELAKEKRVKYLENENIDTMFLIRKRKN